MNISLLDPMPMYREIFRRDRRIFVSENSGCYVLANFKGVVLYVGLTKNLRRRFGEHLDDPRMCAVTENGSAFFFHWLECNELEKIERTWQNECEIADGELPIMNRVRSPMST